MIDKAITSKRRVHVYYGEIPSCHRPEWATPETGWIARYSDYWANPDGSETNAVSEYHGLGFPGDPRGKKKTNERAAIKLAAEIGGIAESDVTFGN
jgi:hypothetical protein